MLLLHFWPLATFDALGPSFLSLLCALFFFFISGVPLRAPSLSFCCCPSSSHSVSSLPSVCGSEAAVCMGIGPIQVAHPHCEVCSGWSNPKTPPPTPPPPPFLPFTASIWCVRSEFGSLGKSRRSSRSFDCLGGISVCLKDERVVGRTSFSSYGPIPLLQAVRLVILWLHHRWLHPRRLSFPSRPINSCLPLSFRLD